MSDVDVIAALREKFLDTDLDLPDRYRAMFSLRGVGGMDAIDALLEGLEDESLLLRHEICFLLGQMQAPVAARALSEVLSDSNEHAMVRHEAAEALGAIGTTICHESLKAHEFDDCQEVRETCQLALRRIADLQQEGGMHKDNSTAHLGHRALEAEAELPNKSESSIKSPDPPAAAEAVKANLSMEERLMTGSTKEKMAQAAAVAAHGAAAASESPYFSVDPAPAMDTDESSAHLRAVLLDESGDMFERYKALFTLRNRGGPEELDALTAVFGATSALLKHEVAYVLGQLQKDGAVETLATILEDKNENAMVRHEAAEALGSIAVPRCIELLKEYMKDDDPIVSDSCEIALDILEYEVSGAFQYADMAPSIPSSGHAVEAH
uniref:Deoxyhypusine hydroxylase n=1 Tax=Pyramimonas obovata TaxID=1411642 RepID=A0A7S0R6P0_9CHLO|mmetsp:Transcript_26927/g.58768  ORF Transcript_26927/g.58768 Transcript_26927/m.58768 type:complete len:381 (+) Transcript_26927:118-1260(+)